MSLASDFAALFTGRGDAWGAVEGRSVQEHVTHAHWVRHLDTPNSSMGIYPMLDNGLTHWGCADIDFGFEQSYPLALNLHEALRLLGITSWIERTKGKGYHIWVFLQHEEWIHASYMRNALLVAHEIAGVPPKEVNPKNPDPTQVSWGNYVNLPYAFDWKGTGKRCVLLGVDELSVSAFVDRAQCNLNSVESIQAAAALYVPPPPEVAVSISEYDGTLTALTERMKGLTFKIFREGPLPGRDRSTTMIRLMHFCKEDGFTPSEAMAILDDFDQRLGKFVGRADREKELTKMIQRVYG